MDEKEKAKKILKILNKIYPTTPIPLNHINNFTLTNVSSSISTMHRFKC